MRERNVRIDVLAERLRQRTRLYIELFGLVVLFLSFCLMVIWFAVPFFMSSFSSMKLRRRRAGCLTAGCSSHSSSPVLACWRCPAWAVSRAFGLPCGPPEHRSLDSRLDGTHIMPFYEILALSFLGVFILSLFTGFPVAWLLGGLSLIVVAISLQLNGMGYDTFLLTSWDKLGGVVDRFDAIMSNWVLVSLPMFVYMGLMLDKSGVADIMMRNFVKVFGGLKGGLGLTVVVIGILLGGIHRHRGRFRGAAGRAGDAGHAQPGLQQGAGLWRGGSLRNPGHPDPTLHHAGVDG
jgi:hypothetical protein